MAARRPPYDPDPFTFMIESVDATGKLTEPLGGCINVHGAIATFNALVACYGPNTRVHLRHGGRIMRKANGTGGDVVFFGGER